MSKRNGFTLIEILVTVLVIGVLAAIAVPYYQTGVDKSRFASLMPIAKTVKDAQESFWLERGGQYSNDLGLLATSVTHDAQGTTATLGDVAVEISNNPEYSYVKTSKPGLNNNFVYYQDHSVNYPGEMHCEALQDNARAAKVCTSQGGEKIAGYLTEGYDTYLLKGVGDGLSFSLAQILAHAGAGWQSCDTYPCNKECARDTANGYTCHGTYNEDGSYSELVCIPASNGKQACAKTQFDANGNTLSQSFCDLGDGTTCASRVGREYTYDENGNKISQRYCKAYDSNGICTEYSSGSEYTYRADGSYVVHSCATYDSEGKCTAYRTGNYYTYDANGNQIAQRSCSTYDSDGLTCVTWSSGADYEYDAHGNKILERTCKASSIDSDGNCTEWSNRRDYTYDANGNTISTRYCSGTKVNSEGNCTGYTSGYDYEYDENGVKRYSRQCNNFTSAGICSFAYESTYGADGKQLMSYGCSQYASDDRTCTSYHTSSDYTKEYVYGPGYQTYRVCSAVDSDGNCSAYKWGYEYLQDENGNRTSSQLRCTAYDSDKHCTAYSGTGSFYTYDGDGNQISERRCTSWDGTTCTSYNLGELYTYDANGNRTSESRCFELDAQGNCTSYIYGWERTFQSEPYDEPICTTYGAGCVEYQYSRKTSERQCGAWDGNGKCTQYTSGSYMTYDTNGNMVSSVACTAYDDSGNCTGYSQGRKYTYDDQGNQTAYVSCKTYDSSGACASYGAGQHYTYDAGGNKTSTRNCSNMNSDGICLSYYSYNNSDYTYDANGNKTSERICKSVNSSGVCTGYDHGYEYTYDVNGNKLSERVCRAYDNSGNCTTYSDTGKEFTYDENGNKTSQSTCSSWSGTTCNNWSTTYY